MEEDKIGLCPVDNEKEFYRILNEYEKKHNTKIIGGGIMFNVWILYGDKMLFPKNNHIVARVSYPEGYRDREGNPIGPTVTRYQIHKEIINDINNADSKKINNKI